MAPSLIFPASTVSAASSWPIDQAWVLTVFLVSLRLAATLVMTPILYAFPMPSAVRALLVVALSVMFTMAFPGWRVDAQIGLGELFVAALSELMLGAILGLSIMLAFAAFSMAGALLDVQIGYGIAQILDPVTRRQVPILTTIFNQIALLVFFLVNGHHALMRGLAYGFERFPPGRPWQIAQAAGPVLKQAAGFFTLGFSLAAPVVFCIFLVEVGLGVLARNLPQMNMFAMGVPVKILVGLSALSLWMLGAGDAMSKIYFSIFKTWEGVFGGAG